MKVAIIGASGYTGEELIRILSLHPNVELVAVASRSLAGVLVADQMPKLKHLVGGLKFSASNPNDLAANLEIELFFLALPHGTASEFAEPLFQAGKTIIDLSADFRLNKNQVYKEFYGQSHPAPHLLEAASYVVPELADDKWHSHSIIACPGCYPTSILIPLVPLLENSLINSKGIIINAYSGVSGAGRKVAENYINDTGNQSMKAYGIPKHRHLSEIEEYLKKAASTSCVVQFSPHLAPTLRGISTTIVAKANSSVGKVYATWNQYYADKSFVRVLPIGTHPNTQDVNGTNRCDISAIYDERTGNVVITAAIDNLIKGASGQAVQLMNLKYGFEETAGLSNRKI